MTAQAARLIGGLRVLCIDDEGPALGQVADALELIGAAGGAGATVVAVPVSRFDPAFFDLSTRLAGEFMQKLVNYGVRLAVIGDLTAFSGRSSALADFVGEANRGRQIWFAPSFTALSERLEGHSHE